MRILHIALVFCIITFFTNCSSTRPRDKERTYSKAYRNEDKNLQASFFVYHSDSLFSQLYFSVSRKQLIYRRADSTGLFSARIKIFYKILPEPDAKYFIDTTTVFVNDKSTAESPDKNITGNIPIRIRSGQVLFVEANVFDDNGKIASGTHYIKCDKRNAYTQQNYLLLGSNNSVYFSNKIVKGNFVTVNNGRVNASKARVEFFINDNSLPPPPFSQREPTPFPSIPDTSYYMDILDGHSFTIKAAKQGIYYMRLDTVKDRGCTVIGVEDGFPKVLSHEQMIAATRFIMTSDEYQKLANATDKQAAIDNFWLSLAGSKDRARELIKRYYNRVQDANAFFTSHIEGWKTDMGMIYLIFGPPNKMYKTENMETWTYGQEGTPNSATFRFEKIKNPFSENNFKLIRNPSYKDPWTIAVTQWREGHVYLDAK